MGKMRSLKKTRGLLLLGRAGGRTAGCGGGCFCSDPSRCSLDHALLLISITQVPTSIRGILARPWIVFRIPRVHTPPPPSPAFVALDSETPLLQPVQPDERMQQIYSHPRSRQLANPVRRIKVRDFTLRLRYSVALRPNARGRNDLAIENIVDIII